MNISLPETLKRFVRQRTKTANFSNPSDYVRSLIRDDQRRIAAEAMLAKLLAERIASDPALSSTAVNELKASFWERWALLKSDIDSGLNSLENGTPRVVDNELASDIKARGRQRLARAKAL